MKFPYGISHFETIATENYFYQDRTDRIPLVEDTGKNLLFIRPRRFGKSLWLSTLEHYYDIAFKNRFEELFGGLAISQNPTPERNRHFCLRWDFSCVDPTGTVADIDRSKTNSDASVDERKIGKSGGHKKDVPTLPPKTFAMVIA